jgi:hypothetical protein
MVSEKLRAAPVTPLGRVRPGSAILYSPLGARPWRSRVCLAAHEGGRSPRSSHSGGSRSVADLGPPASSRRLLGASEKALRHSAWRRPIATLKRSGPLLSSFEGSRSVADLRASEKTIVALVTVADRTFDLKIIGAWAN